jgi:DNA polymerase I-like protein with 3'-5' exonuclease and polymerase domains
VLQAVTACGLGIDLDRRNHLVRQLDGVLAELRESLSRHGYLPGQPGSDKSLQEILRRLERKHSGIAFPRTSTDRYGTSREALAEVATVEPFVRDLLNYKETEKLKSSFLNKMGRRRLHPSFNSVMVSGRTSSFGEINAQNLPRDDRVRSCFVPTPGHIFVDADYSTLEMATLAQAVQSQFRLPSRMGAAINAGQDLHRVLAARVMGKPAADVSKDERQKAKPVNFGLPGGMGLAGLQRYARASYGVELTEDDAQSLSDAWFELFPEMDAFLDENTELGQRVAQFFDITPLGYYEHTGQRQFLFRPDSIGREREPNPILGGMFLKTLRVADPKTRGGACYRPDEIDYFWSRAHSRLDDFPKPVQTAVRTRKPSTRLQRAALSLVDREPVFTLTGRLRANASYCARHNTVFQGLAADGAKLALWLLWRAGYRIVNFIHDEVLIEIPVDSRLDGTCQPDQSLDDPRNEGSRARHSH